MVEVVISSGGIVDAEFLLSLIELGEWKKGTIDYLTKHDKTEEWKNYKKIDAIVPDFIRLLLFLQCVYTQVDDINDEQYKLFIDLCENEPEKSKRIRRHLIDNQCFKFTDDGYITIYRGWHGLSDTSKGKDHTASKDVEYGISWTYESTVAGFFAVRTQADDCRIYTATIHKDDVLMIYDDRTEAEVIIKPICLGTNLIGLREDTIVSNIDVMRKFFAYREEENLKYSDDTLII